MSASTRPPLLQLGGEDNFRLYEREFRRLYQGEAKITDVLGNHIVFEAASCHHVCFKRDEEDQSERRPRNIWSQERAEHLPWIMFALTDARTEVRPNNNYPDRRVNYLIEIEAEYYVVVAEWISKKSLRFTTAYPIKASDWRNYKRAGRALYSLTKKKGEQ